MITFYEARTGEAVAEAAEPGDTLTVFGGRADIQYAAGLPSPYQHLWSLPMRTLDPELDRAQVAGQRRRRPHLDRRVGRLRGLERGRRRALRADVEARYVVHGLGCDDRPVYLLKGVDRPAPRRPNCDCRDPSERF